MLWMEYPEYEEALCRCAIMKGAAMGLSMESPQVLQILTDMCRHTSRIKAKA